MGALEVFKSICEMSENTINEHFRNLDTLEDKSQSEPLYLSNVAEAISNNLSCKQVECLNSIHLYLKDREDLEVKNGKIIRIGDKPVAKIGMTPKECGLRFYNSVKTCAHDVIQTEFVKAREVATAEGGRAKVNFRDLSDTIASMLNIKPYAAYHCLVEFIKEERKDLKIEKGRYGGLVEIA